MLRAGARHPDASPSTSADVAAMELEDYATLNEYLQMEHKFQPKLCLPTESENGEVTTGARDGAAHVLRCLKVWYDLPTDVLIDAISLFDRFLTKMKVRPCHVPCITVACMNIAIDQYAAQTKEARKVSVEELVSISQSACTAGDVARMSRVVVDKLALAPGSRAVTARDWIRLFVRLLLPHCPTPPEESDLLKLLEIVICDAMCANARTSELALVLVYLHLEQRLVALLQARASSLPDHAYQLFDAGAQLQHYCQMADASLVATRARAQAALARYEARAAAPQRQRLVWRLSERTLKMADASLVATRARAQAALARYEARAAAPQRQRLVWRLSERTLKMSDASLVATRARAQAALARYEARAAAPQRQRLVWRLSERTLKVLRPTDRLTSLLPTIEEQQYAVEATPARTRSGSESSENEETSDWPRSPVLPVYCDH